MPYDVRKRGAQWVVVKLIKRVGGEQSTQIVGRHDTRKSAYKQLAALNINVEDA